MKQEKHGARELAETLGISRVTIYTLKRNYPDDAPKDFSDVKRWRAFALKFVIDSEAIERLTRQK